MAPVAIAVYDEYFGLNQDEPEETYEDTTNTLQGAGTGGSTVIAAEE